MKPSARLVEAIAGRGRPDPAARPCATTPDTETITRWRVMPTDLDLFGHMDNDRFLLIMDHARVDYIARAKFGMAPLPTRIAPAGDGFTLGSPECSLA